MGKKQQDGYYMGTIDLVRPYGSKWSSGSSGTKKIYLNESNEMEKTTKASFMDNYGKCSTKIWKSQKAEEFVDNKSGRFGYKEEAKYSSTSKYDDKIGGYSTEYHTQVKVKKKVSYHPYAYPTASKSKTNNKSVNYYLLAPNI